jgi:hypothetical protein
VSGVHELLQAIGSSVAVVRSVEVNAVIAPIAVTGKLGHGHQLDGVDAELFEI